MQPIGDQFRRDGVQRDGLFLAIERSIRVRVETDFFSWTQGCLQAAVPHDALLCASFDPQGRLLDTHVCSPVRMPETSSAALIRGQDGLLHRLLLLWDANGRAPLLVDADEPAGKLTPPLLDTLRALAFSKLVAHGSSGPGGAVDTFFAFAGVRSPLDRRVAEMVELIVPHLRSAFVRLQPRKSKPRPTNRARTLTNREGEVLQLMQHGRSNAEIGAVLSISPLTVKNHVQKVLRKLGVRNRTQAVALHAAKRWHCDD